MNPRKSLADLADAFKGPEDASWKLFLPFWKAEVDKTTIFRFFPDANIDNPRGFLVENHVHELYTNGKRQKFACLRMYGENCPVCDQSAKFYDKNSLDSDEDKGRMLYRKRSYIGQGMVISTPVDNINLDQLWLIEIGPKIFDRIKRAFTNGDMDNPPYEFKGGYNFRIAKSQSGQYPDYGSSSFSPKQSDVPLDFIEKVTLHNLIEQRTPRSSPEVLEVAMLAMLTGGGPPRTASAPLPTTAGAPTGSSTIAALRARQAAERAAREAQNQTE